MASFQGVGQWSGCAEVFSGDGRFLGNATDQRNVQALPDGSIRIDLAFIGPIKVSGHYTITPEGSRRLYRGPANIGMAETIAPELVDANAFWPDMGLSQRFFLYLLAGGERQLSLALMSRGDQLLYVIVGENQRVKDEAAHIPNLIAGTELDFRHDPNAGRGCCLLHRSGTWRGTTTVIEGDASSPRTVDYTESIADNAGSLAVQRTGVAGVAPSQQFGLRVSGNGAWTPQAGDVVGSFSTYGGRAQTAMLYNQRTHWRGWQREVVSSDGAHKVIVHFWHHGSARVALQFGVLDFDG